MLLLLTEAHIMTASRTESTSVAIIDEQANASGANLPTHLGEMSDLAFNQAVARAKTAQKRLQRLFDEVLVEGAHYGNPKAPNGKTAFNKPICYKGGADSLAEGFRLHIEKPADAEDAVIATEEFCSVTVTRILLNWAGVVLDRATASCTTKEKRFRTKYGDDGWVYRDARECLNDCYAMAEKRAKVRMVVATLGLGPWLAAEEEMEASVAEGVVENAAEPPKPPAAKAPARAAAEKGPFMRFGRSKGESLSGIETRDLESAIAWAREKGKFADGIEEMEAELEIRRLADADSDLGLDDPRPSHDALRNG
jgi:hypothetical protein